MSFVRSLRGLPWRWGSVEAVDVSGDGSDAKGRLVTRAVECSAAPGELFLWLCQLRRAPYSYDWLDNFGRRSPRTADPSLTQLVAGQSVMTIFTLTGFEPDRSVTIRMRRGWPTRVFGAIAVRYSIVPAGEGRTVLRADLWMPRIGVVLGRFRRYLLAWGDLVMMRKQLRTLRLLAERTPAATVDAVRTGGP